MGRGFLIYLLLNTLALRAKYTLVEAQCDAPDVKLNDRDVDPADCTKYFECGAIPGVFTREVCPHGTGFNPVTKTCMWRTITGSNQKCFKEVVGDLICEDPPLTVADIMRNQCVPEGTYITENDAKRPDCKLKVAGKVKYEGKFVADPDNCAGYYLCENGVRLKGTCDETRYNFDPLKQRCALKESLPCSVDGSVSISACDGEKSGALVADENICTAFFRCTGNNAGYQEFCETGKYFSEGKCVSQRPSRCSCEDWNKIASGEFAHEDPTKYWECKKGMREEKTCPYGTKWSQAEESCIIN